MSWFHLQAVDSRDSVAMALYSQCFSWIIMRINQKIKGKDNFKSIGILDIFGFENFEVKSRWSLKFLSNKYLKKTYFLYQLLTTSKRTVLHERFECLLLILLCTIWCYTGIDCFDGAPPFSAWICFVWRLSIKSDQTRLHSPDEAGSRSEFRGVKLW